jgi:hypothetical protein
MKPGKTRFDLQIAKIENLISQAVTHGNAPLWLFLHDLRTPMFMLEGLSKLYAEINDDKIFTKLKEQFKQIEDSLGAVDYYAAFQKEFADNAAIPDTIKTYFRRKTNEKLELLGNILKEEGWLDGKKMKSITKKLDEIKWAEEVEEGKLLIKFYAKQIKKINEFVVETGFPFTNIEEHVHEIRRRIRWLSIYPQALNGAIKFAEIYPKPKYLTKYLTPNIVNSPFNVLPVSESQSIFLTFDKNKFLALSCTISQLGELKDKGLKINALKDAFQETLMQKDSDAYTQTYAILGKKYPTLETILTEASDLFKTFFDENNLDFVIKSEVTSEK